MFGLETALIEQLKQIFAGHTEIEQVILFGSRAKGTHRTGSDIDLAIELNGHGLLESGQLAEEIDQLNTPYLFDLVDFGQINNPALIQHIQDFGQPLYIKGTIQ